MVGSIVQIIEQWINIYMKPILQMIDNVDCRAQIYCKKEEVDDVFLK